MMAPSSLASSVMQLYPQFTLHTTKGRVPSFRNRVVQQGSALANLKSSFFRNFFPYFLFFLGGFLNQLPNRRQKRLSLATRQSLLLTSEQDFTLQTNAFIASDEYSLCYSPSNTDHTADEHVQATTRLLVSHLPPTFIGNPRTVTLLTSLHTVLPPGWRSRVVLFFLLPSSVARESL